VALSTISNMNPSPPQPIARLSLDARFFGLPGYHSP
jgi:hypothetical protein